MTENYGNTAPSEETMSGAGSTGPDSTSSTTQAAKEQAGAVGHDAKQAGQHVASVAKDEAMNVKDEAGTQARQLWSSTQSELKDQAAEQQQRLASGLRSLGDELKSMASGSEQSGMATDLARQASSRVSELAQWLEDREPGSVVQEMQRFARRRPGTFLAAAAGLGLVGGRLSRGMMADHQEQKGGQGQAGMTAGQGMQEGDYQSEGGPSQGMSTPMAPPAGGISRGSAADPSPGPATDPLTRGVPDPLDPIDPRTGRQRTGAGADAPDHGGQASR
jgi:hypothetical protein